jgi:DnaJ-class molecular chaperone
MTESLSEVANRGRSTETVDPLARTDGRTNEAVTNPAMNPSSNATPTGGLKEFTEAALYPHDHLPHECATCNGTGVYPADTQDCDDCDGTGISL